MVFFAYAAQYNSTDKIKKIFNMITYNSAKVMRLNDYGIKEDNPQDLICFLQK